MHRNSGKGYNNIVDTDATYRMSGKLYSYDELVEALNAEAATIPEDTWRDGVWNVHDYIIEASQVGIIEVILGDDDDVAASPLPEQRGDERR